MIEFIGDLVEWFATTWDGPTGWVVRTGEHLAVSGAALGAALLVALPPAAWLGHRHRGALVATALANVGRALPSFGIVALALPITIRLADALPFIDSGLGFLPTVVALFALAVPPIFTAAHTAVMSADPDAVEAARGVGMSPHRILLAVELPLAAPALVATMRFTAIQVVATAPLGALVAYGGLGRFIVDGFAVRDSVEIVGGAVLVLGVALLADRTVATIGALAIPPPLRRPGNRWGATGVDRVPRRLGAPR